MKEQEKKRALRGYGKEFFRDSGNKARSIVKPATGFLDQQELN